MKQTELFLFDKVVNIDEDVAKFKNREIKAKEIFVKFGYQYQNNKDENKQSTFDFNNATNAYDDFNLALSTDFEYTDIRNSPGIELSIRKEKWFARDEVLVFDDRDYRVRVQEDPYHDGSATGLAFDNHFFEDSKKVSGAYRMVRISPSLKSIFKKIMPELGTTVKDWNDLDIEANKRCFDSTKPGCYSGVYSWLGHLPKQGVLLLNTALTVEKGKAGSHSKLWKPFTDAVIKRLLERDDIVFVVWGGHALNAITRNLPKIKEDEMLDVGITDNIEYIDLSSRFIVSSHPSPLGANKTLCADKFPAFNAIDCFNMVNDVLEKELEKEPIIW